MSYWDFDSLIGSTLTACQTTGDEIIFKLDDGREFRLGHQQDCCESVRVEDICGDLQDLVGWPIVQAEESSSHDTPEDVSLDYESGSSTYEPESCTWTFYRIATARGLVVIRFYGTSNGYYSESVDFYEITADRRY